MNQFDIVHIPLHNSTIRVKKEWIRIAHSRFTGLDQIGNGKEYYIIIHKNLLVSVSDIHYPFRNKNVNYNLRREISLISFLFLSALHSIYLSQWQLVDCLEYLGEGHWPCDSWGWTTGCFVGIKLSFLEYIIITTMVVRFGFDVREPST